jgi:hypothetical protein
MTVKPHSSKSLVADSVVSYRMAAREYIRCRTGSLWITQDSDPRDVVLGPGDLFLPDRDARVLVSALEASSFTVESDREAHANPVPQPCARTPQCAATGWVGA